MDLIEDATVSQSEVIAGHFMDQQDEKNLPAVWQSRRVKNLYNCAEGA